MNTFFFFWMLSADTFHKYDVFTAVCFRGSGKVWIFITWVSSTTKGKTTWFDELRMWKRAPEPCHSDLAFVVTLGSRYVTLVNLSPRVRRPRGDLLWSTWFNYTRSIKLWVSDDRPECVCVSVVARGGEQSLICGFVDLCLSLLSVVP